MKKIIAIFSVMLTCFAMLISDGYGAGSCRQHLCKTDEDFTELLSVDGITGNDTGGSSKSSLAGKMCYHCDINNMWGGIGDDDCGFNTYVATVTASETKLFMCNDDSGDDDSWEKIDLSSLSVCSNSVLIRQGVSNATCVLSNSSGTDVVVTTTVSGPCMKCSCNVGFKENTAKTECIVDTSAQERCENDPSHGQWNGSKCLCGADKTNRDENQTYKVQNQECKCLEPNIWNGSECANPEQSLIDECQNSPSNGRWVGGDVKCDCTGVEPQKQQSPDKMTCVLNIRYTRCYETHGTWSNNRADGSCVCDGNKGLEPHGEVCKCKDADAVWYPQDDRCDTSPRALCEGTGGAFIPIQPDSDFGNCNCGAEPDKNLKIKYGVMPERCVCKNPDYDWKSDSDKTQGCDLKPEARSRQNSFETLKRICERDWNSRWSPEHWEWEYNGIDNPNGRDPSKWKCTCTGDGVKQFEDKSCQCNAEEGWVLQSANPPYKCEQPECPALMRACEALGDNARYRSFGVVHNRESCVCECTDTNKVYAGGQCIDVDNPIAKICESISGATIRHSGKCVCLSTRQPPINGKCPPSTSNGNASSGTVATVTDTRDKEENIKTLYGQLTSISNDFKKSHWKTASGNFNGARLASDSIAGVVLGTVGGVVTSNVIKKNQVKGGFESLQCTVGGQFVADFADQFQVGIR